MFRTTMLILAAVTAFTAPIAAASETKQPTALSGNGAAPEPSKTAPIVQNPSFPRPATPQAAMPVNPPLAAPIAEPAAPVARPLAAPARRSLAPVRVKQVRTRVPVRRVAVHRERPVAAPRRKVAKAYRPAPVRYAVRRATAPGTDARGCRFVPRATGGGFRGDTIEVCG